MAAHLPVPWLPVLLFVFLAVQLPSSTHGDPRLPSTYNVNMCSEESTSCGGVEIRYPFYLANATEATADHSGNFSCGYTDLSISCTLQGQTWTPTIRLGGGDEYTVENISYNNDNYDDGTILLVDSDVLLEGGDCPAVRHDVSFDETWLHSISHSDNLTFFFGCYPRGGPVPPEFYAYRINCTLFKDPSDAGQGDSFVLTPEELDSVRYLVQEFAANCSKVVTVPVIGNLIEASIQSNFTKGGYGDVLKRGFVLEWHRRLPFAADQCYQCEGSKGQCAYAPDREFLGCLCSGGKVGDPDCNHIVRASSDDYYNSSICKLQPYPCGKVNISYPFYLSGETADVLGNYSYCGYPGLAIDCVDEEYPVIQLGSGSSTGYSYNVTGIDYPNSTIYLSDPDVLDDQGCPRVDHNVL